MCYVTLNLEILFQTFSTNHHSAHGMYEQYHVIHELRDSHVLRDSHGISHVLRGTTRTSHGQNDGSLKKFEKESRDSAPPYLQLAVTLS